MAYLYLVPLALALLAVPSVEGQVPGFGKCPKVDVQQNFTIEPYMGKWYEIEKFPTVFEVGKCITANYTLQADLHVRIVNQGVDKGKPNMIVGDAYTPDPNEPAKLKVRFFSAAPYGDYWVLKTDYKTYTMVWSCSEILGLGNTQQMWILARKREIDPALKAELHKVASGYGIDVNHFTPSVQTGCDN